MQPIDFGIACELAHESDGVANPHALEGTLRYMAPEQTGRMNRRVDYRADFYALGATFYELLTGQPPFDARDETALVHCHIVRSPDWSHPALASLPGQLLPIVQRLMEKNADQRYQSLQGLQDDLAACRGAAPAHAAPRLSRHDGRFIVPQTLHGREDAVHALLAAFARVAAGACEMLLVAGYSGIGKSAVVHQVYAALILLGALRRDPARGDAGAVLERIGAMQASLAGWASRGSDNSGAKSLLVQAETARLRHDLQRATGLYQEAIDAAALAGDVNMQALANALCGECWFDHGQPRVAAVFFKDAIARYGQWGAGAMVAQLRAPWRLAGARRWAGRAHPPRSLPEGRADRLAWRFAHPGRRCARHGVARESGADPVERNRAAACAGAPDRHRARQRRRPGRPAGAVA